MTNLEKISGLPIELTDDFHLRFHAPLMSKMPAVRKFSEMLPVLMDPTAKPDPAREEMYYMYRDVHLPEDEAKIRKHNLRYDMAVLPAAMLGQEFAKTVGHYHPNIPGQSVAYPEVYEIIHGEALLLIQKMDETTDEVRTVMAIEAKAGDKVVYPPNYGHIMVNIGSGPLITSNWEADHFESLYEPIRNHKGMAYYVIRGKDKAYEFVPNPTYRDVPPVRIINQKFMNFPITGPKPMYTAGIRNPKDLEFLSDPAKYAVELSSITS